MKIKIAVSSWGNIGKAVAEIHNIEKKAADCDIELIGIIRRNAKADDSCPPGVPVTNEAGRLPSKPDVIICAAPSHCVMEDVQKYLELGISTVDCFDNHKEIPGWRERLDLIAKRNRAVAVTASGWDPGFDSVVRALTGLVVTENEPVTTFGPGRSMGHTTTVKAIHPDIKDAVSITLPGAAPGLQRREVFVVLKAAGDTEALQNRIRNEILVHPYFRNDDTQVSFVESIAAHNTDKNGGLITRESEAAKVEVKLHGNNALMTAASMYAASRAAFRVLKAGGSGCLTLAEIAPLDFVKGETVKERLAAVKY